MPCWYYDKRELRHSPSIKAGLTLDQETLYRREGARFILQIGNKMGLRYETMATGVVFFHRFYMVHTFLEFPRHVTACCCLFLAGKVEETPKKCRDIMKTAKNLMKEDTWAEFGTDPREEVMTLERIILQTIKFDFIVEHPYAYLLKYAKCLKGDKKKLQNMVQMAWTFVNDSLCTTLCLQWEAEIIAIALMYLAGKLSKFEVTDWIGRTSRHAKWWDMYTQGITTDLLEDICHQVLDLYAPNKTEGAGGDAKRSSAVDRSAAETAASAGATRGKTQAAVALALLPQQPAAAVQQQQQQPTKPIAQQQQPSDKILPASITTSAIPTMPVPVITSSSISTTSKDELDGCVGVTEAAVASRPGASSSSSSASFSQYGNYQYPGYNPSYPPPPPAATQRYSYSPYQAPPAPATPTTPHAPPTASTHYQAPPAQTPPTTPRAPPPVTHYPPPVTPNTQAPPPSHYTPYSTTPSHPPPGHPPPYRLPPAPASYTPHTPQSMHPSPHYPPHAPPHAAHTTPNPPYYPARDANSPYNTPQNQYQNRSYYGSGS